MNYCDYAECAKPHPSAELLLCSRCKINKYCNKDCQKADWQDHKGFCELQDDKYKRFLDLFGQNFVLSPELIASVFPNLEDRETTTLTIALTLDNFIGEHRAEPSHKIINSNQNAIKKQVGDIRVVFFIVDDKGELAIAERFYY